jgi:hypothetical protein
MALCKASGGKLMSAELFWLVLTVAVTGWVPYILDRIMVRGLMGAMANPSANDKAQSPWARSFAAGFVAQVLLVLAIFKLI